MRRTTGADKDLREAVHRRTRSKNPPYESREKPALIGVSYRQLREYLVLSYLVVKLFYDMVWMLYENLGLLRLTLRKKGVIFRDVVRLDYKSKLSL